jgi:hypothetical protein
MTPPDPIDIADEREYAWLLERSDTLAGAMVEVWRSVPVRAGSIISALFAYPLRLVLLTATVLLVAALMLGMILVAAVAPVTLFTLVEPWLPDGVWLAALVLAAATMLAYLLMALVAHLHIASRGPEAVDELPAFLRDDIVAKPVAAGEAWSADHTLHVSHEGSRRRLYAAVLLVLGILLQGVAVVRGEAWFAGPVDGTLAWALFFARSLFDTVLLGIPSAVVPPWSAIAPAGRAGEVLMVGVDLCFAAGLLALLVSSLSTAFKLRELFNGTTRDLADYLHDADVSGGDTVTIHRVAVVRPLDRTEVVTLSKSEFFERLGATR